MIFSKAFFSLLKKSGIATFRNILHRLGMSTLEESETAM